MAESMRNGMVCMADNLYVCYIDLELYVYVCGRIRGGFGLVGTYVLLEIASYSASMIGHSNQIAC